MVADEKEPRIQVKPGQLPVNQETLEILVANIIPTSKYFETRFDHLEHRVIRIEDEIKDFRLDVDKRFEQMKINSDKRFEQVDKRFEQMKIDSDKRFEQMKIDSDRRFEQVDKRFEQVDKRFEQVDKRFEQIIYSIDRLSDNLDKRDNVQRSFTMRMFSISIVISFVGVLGVALKLFGV